jgi:hypothetical protein
VRNVMVRTLLLNLGWRLYDLYCFKEAMACEDCFEGDREEGQRYSADRMEEWLEIL